MIGLKQPPATVTTEKKQGNSTARAADQSGVLESLALENGDLHDAARSSANQPARHSAPYLAHAMQLR